MIAALEGQKDKAADVDRVRKFLDGDDDDQTAAFIAALHLGVSGLTWADWEALR